MFKIENILLKMSVKWTDKETEQFYEALRVYGTDFTMMLTVFSNRTQRQIKNKYKKEDRNNPSRVTRAIYNS